MQRAPPNTMALDHDKIKALALTVLDTEAQAIEALKTRVGEAFFEACRLLHDCKGRVVLMGIGKSGHIANKIASTLASTGSPAFYIHPAEAGHGDFGMLCRDDVAVLVSHSGETDEVNVLLAPLKDLKIPVIALTGEPNSTLGKAATTCLDCGVSQEACPLGLAPTASTAAALAMGDALATALLLTKGFTPDDFARTHPGGRLGRRLILRVESLMRTGDAIPTVPAGTPLMDALWETSAKGLGMTLVTDADGRVVGIFTDGDLRRAVDKRVDVHATPIDAVMTRDFHSARVGELAIEVLAVMEAKKINSMPVLDEDGELAGALNLHILLHAGL